MFVSWVLISITIVADVDANGDMSDNEGSLNSDHHISRQEDEDSMDSDRDDGALNLVST